MVNGYTLYLWESKINGSSCFCYDLVNNRTNELESGGGCIDPYELSEEIKKERFFSKLENISVQYVGEPSPLSDLGPDKDFELNQEIRFYLERALDIDINYFWSLI